MKNTRNANLKKLETSLTVYESSSQNLKTLKIKKKKFFNKPKA